MEIKKELQIIKSIYKCDKCEKGEMKYTHILSDIPGFDHICDNCKYETRFPTIYPATHYVEKND